VNGEEHPPSGSRKAPEGASRFSILVCHAKDDEEEIVITTILIKDGDIIRACTSSGSSEWCRMHCTKLNFIGDSSDEVRVHDSFLVLSENAGLSEIDPSKMETHGLYDMMVQD
jgi:hypothetical protein